MLLTAGLAGSAQAQVDPNSGIDFVTIGAVGNAPWMGGPVGYGANQGRGTVNYEYAIGRMEITTAQWTEFYNAALDRPVTDRLPWVTRPSVWGASATTPSNPGGSRWAVPNGNELRAVGGVTWRTAAMYCNWLHNGKASDRDAFLSGAYNVSTFGVVGSSGVLFSDQLTRSEGARYWIPSIDEWMKAAHYDPNKINSDGSTGGWWKYVHSRDDRAPIYGPAGFSRNGLLTEANAAWNTFTPQIDAFTIPLGAYSSMTSPWGLLDTSGATAEWTEEVFQLDDEIAPRERYAEGGAWRSGSQFNDDAGFRSVTAWPDESEFLIGLRVATVPSPGCGGMVVALSISSLAIRRRRNHAELCS
jgi:hypothetical protein